MWGATMLQIVQSAMTSYFNPRTHVGCDKVDSYFLLWQLNFNPRTHVGCDKITEDSYCVSNIFQSTHPCGVRLIPTHLLCNVANFNPRTHVGCDWRRSVYLVPFFISIHAPMWGATSWIFSGSWNNWYFNPRTHVGCDLLILNFFTCPIRFQSTHPCGVRRFRLVSCVSCWQLFQSTHPCGVRQVMSDV